MLKVCVKHGVEYTGTEYRMRCPECNKESCKEYRRKHRKVGQKWCRSIAGKASRLKYARSAKGKAYTKRNIDQIHARSKVGREVKKGNLVVPKICSQCGLSIKVQAHHHLGYEKEHRLDVLWLCLSCHLASHNKNPI